MFAVQAAGALVIGLITGSVGVVLLIGAVLLIVGTIFGSLTTSVDHEAVECRFGLTGWPTERIRLHDIRAARAVRTSPLHGWGMRYTLHGRLWNVWGLDAVELQLTDGRRFRIGTDEPEALLRALERAGVAVSRSTG